MAALLVMGVSGCGKSTVARLLAQRMSAEFLEGDAFHPRANIEKMSAGIPLTDEDRRPWLDLLAEASARLDRQGHTVVLACSALKTAYRDRLRKTLPGLRVIYLQGSPELIARRLVCRKRHYMPPGLLESQFADLEEPRDALIVNIEAAPEELVAEILRRLEAGN